LRQWSGSDEAQDDVVEVVLVRCTSASASWRQLCLGLSCYVLEGIAVAVALDNDVGYQLRRDGGGRQWIGREGVVDGGVWGFTPGGEGVLVPTEYEWGNGGRGN
jgi:hypothetical protein